MKHPLQNIALEQKTPKNKVFRGGYSLAETIVYIALLIILLGAVVDATLLLSTAYKNVKAVRSIENSAITSMDRMIREIRNADSVSAVTAGVANGALTLSTTDIASQPVTLRFYLSSGKVMLDKNGALVGPLTESDVIVSSLDFHSIATTTSAAVRVELTIESNAGQSYVSKKFYDTAVLRGSYK